MSGDVQPRKRKDKKRRKDEGEQIPIQAHAPSSNNSSSDDVNIHVHKEGGTGGGICAKLVFFVLFSALIVVIGMIITEYRGLTDVETVDTESRYSQIFEGWTDTSPDHHNDHNIEDDLDDHDLDHDEDDDEHNASEEDEEDEEDPELSEEEEDEEPEDVELSDEQNEEDEEDKDDDEEENLEDSDENQLDEDEEDEEIPASEEDKDTYDSDEKDEEEEYEQDHDEDEQELENIESEEDDDDDVSEEKRDVKDQDQEEDENDEPDADEDGDDEKSIEKEDMAVKKVEAEDTVDEDAQEEETQQGSAGSPAERQADVENSDSEKSDDDDGYEFSNITNKADYKLKTEIDEAQKSVQSNSAYAIKLFDKILQNHPSSPRSIYGKALALDYLADQKRSNDILEQALKLYTQLFHSPNVPNALYEAAAERCIKRMRFVGQYRRAINVHKLLIQRFPNNPKHSNDLAVTYLTINRVEEARTVLQQILAKWPNDGFALVHYGFILKTSDDELETAVDYLQRGLETRAEGVIDGRFYFHLGDALARLGKKEKAMQVYEEGVKNQVFLSRYQRSLYNVPRLKSKPWWDLQDLPYQDLFRLLKHNWRRIRDEGLAVLNESGYFQDESENLKDTGDWKQFELFARGQKSPNCRACPFTCGIIDRVPEARGCTRGQTKFSVMHPGTHVWPHCGPTNCRLRAHLGLKVPPKTFIRVADETRSWEEGEIFVFDDSFEHEVWHNGTDYRLVLIVDIWHPELTAAEKRSLSPI